MSNPIQTLIKIQQIDLEILEIERAERACREGIAAAVGDIARLTEQFVGLEGDFNSVDATIKELKETIRTNADKISKDEKRLGEITTDKQLKALQKEMQTARKTIKTAEERLEKLKITFDERKARYEAKNDELEARRAELERLTAELEASAPQWERAMREKRAEREGDVLAVGPAILKRYETIKSRRGGVGLVEIKNETCLGCNIHVPPQLYIKILRGDEDFHSCPNCHRLLFYCAPPCQTQAGQ